MQEKIIEVDNSTKLRKEVISNNYKTLKFGNQIWMTENLCVRTPTGWYLYGNKKNEPINVYEYGYLYEREAAILAGKCFEGWRLPTKEDWQELHYYFAENNNVNFVNELNEVDDLVYKQIKKGGNSGFNPLFSGYRLPNGRFDELDIGFYFWSSSIVEKTGECYFYCKSKGKHTNFDVALSDYCFSVRLVCNCK